MVLNKSENVYKYFDITDTNAKFIYRNLVLRQFTKPAVQDVWQNIIHISSNLEWDKIWNNIWKNFLMDSEDNNFLYKLRFRILPTRNILHKTGKINDVKCPLCNTENETQEHFFIYCSRTLNAWIYIEHLLKKLTKNKFFYLNDCNRILGLNLKPVQGIIVCKMLREIWNSRCKIIFDNHYKNMDLVAQFKQNMKRFLVLEKNRLHTIII